MNRHVCATQYNGVLPFTPLGYFKVVYHEEKKEDKKDDRKKTGGFGVCNIRPLNPFLKK